MNFDAKRKLYVFGGLIFFGLLFAMTSWGQSDRGSISGSVVDATGAAIPAVQVSITDTATGVGYTGATTNGSGRYEIVNLPPGSYALLFKRAGFKEYDRNGITILVGQDAKLDVHLQVGAVAETITVTGDASLLDSTTATEATTVTGDVAEELPLSIDGGRNALGVAALSVPTVQYVFIPSAGPSLMVGNSQTYSANVMVDGVDADATLQGGQQPPSLEAVQEIQVQTSGIDAESSQTGGGSFQYELKSGTNQLHGSAYGFLTNEALDANSWADKYWIGSCAQAGAGSSSQCPTDYQKQYRRPLDRHRDWGFSSGGPVWKKHTFIFGDYERYNQNTMTSTPNGTTVPTTQMLSGDFSQLLTYSGIAAVDSACAPLIGAGQPCPTGLTDSGGNPVYFGSIFDPNNPGYVIPGNIIPSGRISALAQKIVQIYKTDYAALNNNLVDNFWGFSGQTNVVQNLDVKLDHHFSEKNQASGSINWAKTDQTGVGNHTGGYLWQKGSATGGPFADSQESPYTFATIHVGDTYTLTPNLINNAIFAFNWARKQDLTAQPAGSAFATGFNWFPEIQFGGSLGSYESTVGQDFADTIRWQQIRFKDTVSWVRGRHVMKLGGEYIGYNVLDNYPSGLSDYWFVPSTGLSDALYNYPNLGAVVGSSFANMLLGAVNGANQSVAAGSHSLRRAFDLIGEDQIEVTKRLTVNLSLRWDVNGRMHELNGKWSNWDPAAQNASWPGLVGAFAYISHPAQSFETNEDYHLFSPHFGTAFAISHKLVARAAWGLFYVPLGNNNWGGVPYNLSGGCFHCYGTSSTLPPSDVVRPGFNWDANTYPGVITPPLENPNANIGGWGISYVTPDILHLGQTQNWNAGIQYSVNNSTVVDVRYMGNSGAHLHDGSLYPQNYSTWSQYHPLLMSGHAGNWIYNQASAQAAGVPYYPFLLTTVGGWGGYNAYSGITPTPQVTAWGPLLVAGYPHGNSYFNGLVAEIKKRAGNGLAMDMSYTFSKAEQNVSNMLNNNGGGGNLTEGWQNSSQFQDPYAFAQMKHLISPNDIRHQVKGYVSYDLPIGRGSRWLNQSRTLDYLVGGWTASGDINYHSGAPMYAVSGTNSYPGWSHTFVNVSTAPGALSNHFKKLDLANLGDSSNQYFNPAAFTDQTTSTSNPLYGTLGNQLPYYSHWRGWAYYDEDIALIKHWGFGPDSRFKASLGGEFFDALNRHAWGTPSYSSPSSPYFGNVTSVWGNRTGQLRARFTW